MVGTKSQTSDHTNDVPSPGDRWRRISLLAALLPMSLALAQCGQAPNAGTLAANSQASMGDTFEDRFPNPQFRDRFPTASESFEQRQATDTPRPRVAQALPAPAQPAPYRVASLAP